MMRLKSVRPALLVALLLVAAGPAFGGLKDPGYKDCLTELKKVLRPPPKDEPVPVEESIKAVREFTKLRDDRVLKELVRAVGPLTRQVVASKEALEKATFKLEQVRIPYFREIEQYFRDHGHFPETILKIRKEAMETLGKIQAETAAAYDAWLRIRDAVQVGLSGHLLALGEDRESIWKAAEKDAAGAKDPAIRAAFCRALRTIPEERAEKILLKLEGKDREIGVIVAALESLAHRRSATGFERLKARLGDSRWEIVVAAVRGICCYRHRETLPSLIERMQGAEGRVLEDLVEALFDLTGKHLPDSSSAWGGWWKAEGREFLTRWSEDREVRLTAIEDVGLSDPKEIDIPAELAALLPTEPDPELRQEILDFLAIHKSHFARTTLLRVLEDPGEDLRIAAIRGLAHYRHLSVPEALMRRVEEAGEKELQAIFQALRKLWGGAREFTVSKPDREALRRWWKMNKDRVGRHFIRQGARDVAAGRPPPELSGHWQDRNFYGLRILSKRVLLVVDISLSMEEPAVEGKERKKIEVAKVELARAIRSLPDDAIFGLIGFADCPLVWREGMMSAIPANRKDALEWVAALRTQAATNIYDTLELSFRIGVPGSEHEGAGMPDTIFFVSDGAATVGKFIDDARILEHVLRWNARRNLKIHAIGVGHDHDVDFLRKLAERSGGHYVAR